MSSVARLRTWEPTAEFAVAVQNIVLRALTRTLSQDDEDAYIAAQSSAWTLIPGIVDDERELKRFVDTEVSARWARQDGGSYKAAMDVWDAAYPGLKSLISAGSWSDQRQFSRRDDEPEWIIQDWLQAGRTCLFVGPGDAGKSRLVAQLVFSFCSGRREWIDGASDILDLEPSPHRAVLVTWEDDHDELERKLSLAGDPQEMGDRLLVRDLSRAGPLWKSGGWTPAAMSVRAEIEESRAEILICDPLAAAYSGNENDRSEVRSFMASLDGWARDARCTVLLVAHPSKAHADYSGSTDWWGAPRSVWQLSPRPIYEDGKKSPEAPCLRLMKANSRRRNVSDVWLGGAPWRSHPAEHAADLWAKWRLG